MAGAGLDSAVNSASKSAAWVSTILASSALSRINRFNSAITLAFASSLEDIVFTSLRSVNAATSVTVPNTFAAATFTLSFVSGLITTETSD
jgi:hypothetical protein